MGRAKLAPERKLFRGAGTPTTLGKTPISHHLCAQ